MEFCEVQRIWEEYFEDLYNVNTREQVVLMIFREVTTSEQSLLEELRLRAE